MIVTNDSRPKCIELQTKRKKKKCFTFHCVKFFHRKIRNWRNLKINELNCNFQFVTYMCLCVCVNTFDVCNFFELDTIETRNKSSDQMYFQGDCNPA